MLVQIDPIEVGNAASPELWNDRFAAITRAMNGEIDSDNLKDGGVTREKIAVGAIDSSRMDIEKYVDANGWTVYDFGGFKTYTRSLVCPALNLGEGTRGEVANIAPPEGRTRSNVVVVTTWYGGYSGHVLLGLENSGASNMTVQVAHNWPSPLVMNGTAHLIAYDKV